MRYTLAKIRKAARDLLTLDEKSSKRLFEGNALLKKISKNRCIGREQNETRLCSWSKTGKIS